MTANSDPRADASESATRSRPARSNSEVVVHRGRHEVERDQLRVRVLDRRAGRLPVVHEGHRVRQAVAEVERGAIAQHAEHVEGGVERERAERPIVRGREHDDLVRAADRTADDRVEVGHDPQAPARLIGVAATEAGDLRRRLVLVPRAERTRGRDRGHRRRLPPERLRTRRALGRDDHQPVGQRIVPASQARSVP